MSNERLNAASPAARGVVLDRDRYREYVVKLSDGSTNRSSRTVANAKRCSRLRGPHLRF
jgi:hypothetical protein